MKPDISLEVRSLDFERKPWCKDCREGVEVKDCLVYTTYACNGKCNYAKRKDKEKCQKQ